MDICFKCKKKIKGEVAFKDRKTYHPKCLRDSSKRTLTKKEALKWLNGG